ncbi:MAG: glutaredoxin family protein [Spirochaetaceae bacterium]|nr:glutaredoxin family protein [Spirochaetaceae bacterium]
MFNNYTWQTIEGKGQAENLTLFSLSTCGFCHSARKYLKDRGLAFQYLELDTIPAEDKTGIKDEFKGKFGRRPSFPTLVINGERFLIGFIKGHWDEEIE